MITFQDLAFEDHPISSDIAEAIVGMPEPLRGFWAAMWMRRALAKFPNGWTLSIIFGPLAFPDWEPGLYESAAIRPDDELVDASMMRGDDRAMQSALDRVGALSFDAIAVDWSLL